jgi:proton-coupled amino acid transporter
MIQIPLSWITNIRKLTVTNALANSLILYGLVTCLLFALDQVIRPSNETRATTDNATVDSSFIETPLNNIVEKWQRLEAFNKDGWFLFIGTSVLLFEGSITLLIPLQEAVQTQHDRQAFAELYPKVILSIITFYTLFGLTCWLAFGNDVNTVMTTSLLENGIDNDEDRSNVHISGLRILAAASVQLAYSLAVLLTFPLQNFPSLEITTAAIGNISGCHRNAVSSTIILLLGVVAVMTMDSLDKVVSLMGALLGCPLAFCVPPLIHNRLVVGNNDNNSFENTTHKSPSNHCWQLFKNKLIVVLGLLAMILASVATLVKWNNGD